MSKDSAHLLHIATRRIINASEMEQLFAKKPEMSPRIGALPFDVLKHIPPKDRAKATQVFDELVVKFAKSVASKIESECSVNDAENKTIEAREKLCSGLRKILKTDDVNIEFVGHGGLKMVFALTIRGQKYALQTFFPHGPGLEHLGHGFINEPQNVFTAYKTFSHGRIARPFIAHVSTNEDRKYNGEYILTKFIDNTIDKRSAINVSRYEKLLSNRRKNLRMRDLHDHNVINGVIIDIGGLYTGETKIRDKRIRAPYQQIVTEIDNLVTNNLKNWELTEDTYKNYYKIYKNNPDAFFDTTKWPEYISQHELSARSLRYFGRIKRIKDKLVKSGDWPKIQELLTQDFNDFFPILKYNQSSNCSFWPLLRDILDIPKPPLITLEEQLKHTAYGFILSDNRDYLMLRSPDYCILNEGNKAKIIDWREFYTINDFHRLAKELEKRKKQRPNAQIIDWSDIITDFLDTKHEKGTKKELEFYNRVMAEHPEFDWKCLRYRIDEQQKEKNKHREKFKKPLGFLKQLFSMRQ